jgi:23S rRNA pseudouridine1911/1915/1917 synthase
MRVLPLATDGLLLPWLLAALAPMSRTRVKQLLRFGQVSVNGVPTTQFDYPLRSGDRVTITTDRPDPAGGSLRAAGIQIVHQDDDLIVLDKPAGLLTVATDSEKTDTAFALLHAHLAARRDGRPVVVHRLDRETSGLLLFARSIAMRDQLQASWDRVRKTYLAVVEGEPSPREGMVRNFLTEGKDLRVRASAGPRLGAKEAITRYQVVRTHQGRSLVEVDLETGRKHQIRVHLAGLGCPVVGDAGYGAKTDPAGRLGLHAWRVAFDHPARGERVEVESPLPDVLRLV